MHPRGASLRSGDGLIVLIQRCANSVRSAGLFEALRCRRESAGVVELWVGSTEFEGSWCRGAFGFDEFGRRPAADEVADGRDGLPKSSAMDSLDISRCALGSPVTPPRRGDGLFHSADEPGGIIVCV